LGENQSNGVQQGGVCGPPVFVCFFLGQWCSVGSVTAEFVSQRDQLARKAQFRVSSSKKMDKLVLRNINTEKEKHNEMLLKGINDVGLKINAK
jgi:hypothetical protein